ncbi:PF06476 family protein [Acinetobacter sp. WC-323]|uniref:DUF1090 domain-containing protein n=1 Tax=Acinetobacter sp. WC-323 TaxID=903918 RepID=UPI00029E0E8A|nr:DUF1090 domain-containing protein [Acinetobacter sp. WC-323]EKU56727.1 PF06476 family protein [Acinetobacter sp. WC-323]
MKKLNLSIIALTLFCSPTYANTDPLKGCTAKKRNIEIQLKHAMLRGNKHEIQGLENALHQNINNCDDADLKAQRTQKVLEKQRKVEKLKVELQQQLAQGDQSKILKKQNKLSKAQDELKQARNELER